MPIKYCGNNGNFPGLINGTHVIGTNYECLRKGVYVGSHLPYDDVYSQPYNPIDNRRIYCGNNVNLPPNYFAIGSPSKCLQVGVGIGKVQRANMGPPAFMYFIRYVLPYLLFVVLSGVIFIILYFTKLKFVSKYDEKSKKEVINWSTFVPYYMLFCVIILIMIIIIWKYYVLKNI
jgi:hypothetical protein